jgi:hypothetical protein
MPYFAYRYELRRGDEILATGHMARLRSKSASGS